MEPGAEPHYGLGGLGPPQAKGLSPKKKKKNIKKKIKKIIFNTFILKIFSFGLPKLFFFNLAPQSLKPDSAPAWNPCTVFNIRTNIQTDNGLKFLPNRNEIVF
jgi:hypothetical protein